MSEILDEKGVFWHGIPHPKDRSTCKVHLIQAGGLTLPNSLVLLPAPDTPGPTFSSTEETNKDNFYVPDFCFLIEHPPSGSKYINDLGMRKDLENYPPAVVKHMLPNFKCFPESPAEIIQTHAFKEHPLTSIKAVIFSHLHFDHVGDAGAAGFQHAELWVGPTSMTRARPGYPIDPQSSNWSKDFPTDGSKKIIELTLPDALLESQNDSRLAQLRESRASGKYDAVERRIPSSGWLALGSFDHACDLFGDGSAYAIDAPGHMPGHMMLLLRVRIDESSADNDDFVLLAGDCYHHPALLRDPRLTARPPYSKRSMHEDPDRAVDTMLRTRVFAQRHNVWVVGAHDPLVLEAVNSGKNPVKGLITIDGWRREGWKDFHGPDPGNLS